jgi:hypothetical protein
MTENPYGTTSLLLASWIQYSKRNPYLGYHDGKFWFVDGEHLIQFLIGGYHGLDPQVGLHEFEKVRSALLSDKLRAGRQR